MMSKKQIGGLIIAVILFIVTGIASVFTNATIEKNVLSKVEDKVMNTKEQNTPLEDYIAVIPITGVIEEQKSSAIFEENQGYQHNTIMEFIDRLTNDPYNKGILLYLDTPGGAVYESDELYLKLEQYKEITGRKIFSYMSHVAASGGYYISMSSDKIYANRNAITGSIGVIISGVDMSGLYEKLGIRYYSATSGDYKDSSKMNDDQMQILQGMVDETYEQFVGVVSNGRNMPTEEVKKLADGRIYSASQAKDKNLIDDIATYEDVTSKMAQELGTDVFYEMEPEQSAFSSIFASIEKIIPRSEAQVLDELKNEQKNGRLMYYAEQLQQ